MSNPIIADNKPIAVELTKGDKYSFCTCGQSANQPFCDGSHKGGEFMPMRFTADKDGKAFLCNCKQTGNAPFCDGSHKALSAEQVGQASS